MKIAVPVQFVPDLVEELIIDAQGNRLDPYAIRWILNEFDDHAIEQAVILKEKGGADITVIAPDFEGADDALFAAAAKGADHLVKITADYDSGINAHGLARLFAPILDGLKPDIILTGVQAHSSLDGSAGALLAETLGLPYVGYVSGIDAGVGKATVRKEYPGGLTAILDVTLPAVFGIQAAETPPRYVPITKVRQAMKTNRIDEESEDLDLSGGLEPARMYPPEVGQRAAMLEGDIDNVAEKIAAILSDQGIL
jgi:electron transfer flavoprotein beta subunit